ncbi:NitT/TauT family transport system permease protein [Kibdelosporangium aridum]|uniref:NitT/TauT family transport system permease protein n=1 Tax=Kibdelosporangium aridum TaxID=2030 RepID=A0A1Y5YBQ2_KIBAR|nr:ABC transporter permease subunit [Kibdelosporangium aridum]SMD26792.1 NitT/TauT family transport system permease protein [Kibdelosporangium aridum]
MRALIGLAVFAALWQALFSPPFHVVLLRLVELLGQRGFQLDIIASVLAWAIAMGIAIAIAVPAGLVLGSVPLLRTATRAVIEFLRPIPSVALIPLAIVAMGGGSDTKIALAVYASVWPILFNTIYSMAEIDPLLVDTARSFGFRRPRILLTVALPHAAPFVFTGIRLAGSIALILIVSTEFLAGAPRGIGTFILNASSGAGRLDLVLAGTLVAGVFGFLVNAGLERLGRKLFRWQP